MVRNHIRQIAVGLGALSLALSACGGSNPQAAPSPSATPSITGDPGKQVLNYQACAKDGKQTIASVLPEAAKAPDLKIETATVAGQGPDMIRVGVLYNYNGGAAKHQVIFELHPSNHALTGEDTISKAAVDAIKAPCK